MQYRVELDDLSAGYDRPLLRRLTLTLAPGEILTLIGPNGAGKSTLLKTLCGQLEKLGGRVFFDGRDTDTVTAEERARKLSVVLTERPDPERMTCREMVRTGRYPYTGRFGILTKADRKAAEDALRLVGAEAIGDRDFSDVSDGQKQRILLARAICQDPDILILDEPTSFLDIHYKLSLLSILQKLARERKITVILSLHEIDLAQKIADRILCIGSGGGLFCGTPEEVFREERIRDLYGITAGSYDTLTGSTELPAVQGEPDVFVLSAGGTGIPVYRRLQREGIPFAAGILWDNDIDCRAARHLAAETVSAPAFREAPPEAVRRAEELIHSVSHVIDCGFPEGEQNHSMKALRELAREAGKLIRPEDL